MRWKRGCVSTSSIRSGCPVFATQPVIPSPTRCRKCLTTSGLRPCAARIRNSFVAGSSRTSEQVVTLSSEVVSRTNSSITDCTSSIELTTSLISLRMVSATYACGATSSAFSMSIRLSRTAAKHQEFQAAGAT